MLKRPFLFLFLLVCCLTSCDKEIKKYESLKSLEKATISVALASPHDSFVTKEFPDAKIMRLENMAEVPLLVREGKADFAVFDRAVAEPLLENTPDLEIVEYNVMRSEIGAGFHLDNIALKDEFNDFIRKFIQTETYADIVKRWDGPNLGDPIPEIPLLTGTKKLKVGVCSSVPPFCIMKDNELQGNSIELIKHFALDRGYTLDIMDMNFTALLSSLQTGRVDILTAGLIYTEERAKSILFSDRYYVSEAVVVAKKGSKQEVDFEDFTFEKLKNSRVAVLQGSTGDIYAEENLPNAQISRVDNVTDLYVMVKSNYVDYAIEDLNIMLSISKSKNDFVIALDSLFCTGVAVAFPKSRQALQQEFNEYQAEFEKTDLYKDMYDRWFIRGEISEKSQVEVNGKGKKLVVAFEPASFPASAIINNRIDGFEVEFIKRFALAKGYDVEFMSLNFASIIAALTTGKVDIGIGMVCSTEERKKKILFSEDYFNVTTGIFCLAKNQNKYKDFVYPQVTPKIEGEAITVDDTMRCYIGKGTVVAVEGTMQEQYASSILPSSQVAITKDYSDAFLNLVSGKSQFLITNIGTASGFKKVQESVDVVLQDVFTYTTHYGLNKQSTALKEEINVFLKKKREDGTLEKLYDKWMTDLDEAEFGDYKFNPDGKVIKLGSGCTAVPFTFILNGEPVGLDIEVMSMFCAEAGYRLEVVEMPFGALISAIVTGKVDVIANTLSTSKERLEKIDFTDSYASNCFALLYNRELVDTKTKGKGLFVGIKESFENNILREKRYLLIVDGLWVTIIISILSIIFGTLVGAGVCSLTMSQSALARWFGNLYVTIIRGTPVLVILMINFYVIFAKSPISPVLVATISFAMNFGAYVSEMFRSSIQSIDRGQTEAGLAMGFSKIQTFIFIVAPQAIRRVLPVYKGEAISLVKMTSVVGYIAVQDITKVGDIIRSRTFDAFFPLLVSALLYFLIAYIFSKVLDLITSKITKVNDNSK